MALEDFLARERTEGEAVGGEASFTLDPNKVRERVAVFSEADSLYPLLRCLQAAIRVSETDIFGQRKGNHDWEFRFRWSACPESRAFEQLLNLGTTAGFDQVGHGVAQHLFFGLSAALGTPHYKMSWNGPQAHFQLSRGEVTVKDIEAEEFTTLAFSIESSWWQKLTKQSPGSGTSEELRRRICYSPKTIHLDQEQVRPFPPRAPERPWAAKLSQGSELAWRFLRTSDKNLLTVPYPELDFYRSDKTGTSFHLVREPPDRRLPLSVCFRNNATKESQKKGETEGLRLSASDRAHSALFLSLEAGRQDWLIPVSDGIATEPVKVSIAGGGIVAMTSEPSLLFDLSGLKVIENDAYFANLEIIKKESRALKKQLMVSLANIGARADHLPKQYDQAVCYAAGGPYIGMLGGRFLPKVRKFFSRSQG